MDLACDGEYDVDLVLRDVVYQLTDRGVVLIERLSVEPAAVHVAVTVVGNDYASQLTTTQQNLSQIKIVVVKKRSITVLFFCFFSSFLHIILLQ